MLARLVDIIRPAVAAIVAASLFFGGCLSVVRIPFPVHEDYSEEGFITNRIWSSFCDDVPGMRVYPTVKMRCKVTEEWLKPIPEGARGKRLHDMMMFKRWGWIPLTFIWATSPPDAAVDTLFLPYDVYKKNNKKDIRR